MCGVPFLKSSFDLKKIQSIESTLEIPGGIRRVSLLFFIFWDQNLIKKIMIFIYIFYQVWLRLKCFILFILIKIINRLATFLMLIEVVFD